MFTSIDILLALLAGISLVWLGRRLNSGLQPVWLFLELFILFCILADRILLSALPRLQISFGHTGLSMFLITGLRLVFFVPALFLLQLQPSRLHAIVLLAGIGLLQAGLFAIEVVGFYLEPFRLTVTRLPVGAPAFLPERPLRILQISDLHVERTTRRERNLLALAESLQPDVIVLTGDYLSSSYDYDPLTRQETRHLLSQLHAPHGVYAINGNSDVSSALSALFDGLENIRVLDNEVLPLRLPAGTLYIVGLTLSRSRSRDARELQILADRLPPGAYSLLIYHTPDLIGTAASMGVDIYLAGHTHGGQIRLPFYGSLFPKSSYGRIYEMGKYLVGSTTLYVSRGIGMAGGISPRARFLCPPELVMIELGK